MIFKFEPHYFERVWGGQSLREILSREIPKDQKIGESWDLVDRDDYVSTVAQPENDQSTIRHLLNSKSDEIMGPGWDNHRKFPILVKWLDCSERLSLQVHPPASVAKTLGGEPKTENWYVFHASKNAGLFLGLKKGKTKEDFLEALKNENLEIVCHYVSSKPGNSVLVESGRMHAIGAGNLILEIQQNSDTTYRVYDWGRKDKQGQSRQLHLNESLQCIDFTDSDASLLASSLSDIQILAECEHFRIRKFRLKPTQNLALKNKHEQCMLINALGSPLQIGTSSLDFGQLALSPFSEPCTITCNEETELIVTDNFYTPEPH
jgi:mannose-6-phosphate isomerase